MRRFTTILCSIAFMIGGLLIATTEDGSGPSLPGTLSVNATPVTFEYNESYVKPFGLEINRTINDNVSDEKPVKIVHDTVWVQKRKIKYVKVPVPKYVQKTDTLYVPSPSQEKQEKDTVIVKLVDHCD